MRARGVRVVDSRSHLHAGTTGDLGWRVGDTGFEIVLSARLPELIGAHLLGDVKALLAEHDLEPADVGAWVVHAGGPRVLDAVRDTLGLAEEDLALSRASLRDVGTCRRRPCCTCSARPWPARTCHPAHRPSSWRSAPG